MTIPASYNFVIYQGATWSETWTRSGVTTAVGWSAVADLCSIDGTVLVPLASPTQIALSSDGSRLIMVPALSAAVTALLVFEMAYYDLMLTHPDGTVEPLLTGVATLQHRRRTP